LVEEELKEVPASSVIWFVGWEKPGLDERAPVTRFHRASQARVDSTRADRVERLGLA
jgi:hypothetical protein